MLGFMLSRFGLTSVLVAVLFLALGVQTLRVRSQAQTIAQSVAVLGTCVADNERLQGEVDRALADIADQNTAIGLLKVEADKATAKAHESAQAALKAGRILRDTRRPNDAPSLNQRLAELFPS